MTATDGERTHDERTDRPLTVSLWPADTSVPLASRTVGDLLRDAAVEAPDRVALVAGHPDPAQRRRWTYAELLADSERVASALLERFEPGQRLAIWAPNEPEWVIVEFASALAGLVLVTVNPALRAAEAEYVLGHSRAGGVVFVETFRDNPIGETVAALAPTLPRLRHLIPLDELATLGAAGPDGPSDGAGTRLPAIDPADAVQIQYTSGTTGRPKGALLHHLGIVNNARFYVQRTELGPGAVLLNPMPLFHTAGCVMATLGSLWLRGTQVLVPQFEPGLVLELIEAERCSSLGAVPTMLVALLEHPDLHRRDLSSLRIGVSGGSPVPAELVRRVENDIGCPLTVVLGQTELAPVITQTRPGDTIEDKADTVGQPLPQVEIAIVDPVTGDPLPIDEPGEIAARGFQAMLGYADDPAATAATVDAAGWLHTGDLGTMDARGYVRVTGRLKDVIIRGGENVYPREIEDVLFDHPIVGEAAVFGLPDERWGESVAAALRLLPDRPAPTPAELEEWARRRLAPHKVPRTWFVVTAMPLTGSGKVQKYVLRNEAATGGLHRLR